MKTELIGKTFTPSDIFRVTNNILGDAVGDVLLRSWFSKGIFQTDLATSSQGVARQYPAKAVYEVMFIRALANMGISFDRIKHILKDILLELSKNELPDYMLLQGGINTTHPHFYNDITLSEAFEEYKPVAWRNVVIDGKTVSVNQGDRMTQCYSIRVIKFREFINKIDEALLEF